MEPAKITDAFKSNIIQDLGIESLPDDEKLRLLERIANVVEARLLIRVGEALSEDGRQKFSDLMTVGDVEKIFSWLGGQGIKIDEWLVEEIAKIKKEIGDRVSTIE